MKQGTERLMTASGPPDRGIKSLLFILDGFYLHSLLQSPQGNVKKTNRNIRFAFFLKRILRN